MSGEQSDSNGLHMSVDSETEQLVKAKPNIHRFPSEIEPASRLESQVDQDFGLRHVKVRPLFTEMMEYKDTQWLETARWVKYEEIVEQGSRRWSKPHVATPSLVSLLQLTSCLNDAVVLLDVTVDTFDDVVELVASSLYDRSIITEQEASQLEYTLTHPKRHQYDQVAKVETKSLFTKSFGTKTTGKPRGQSVSNMDQMALAEDKLVTLQKQHYMRKLPADCEATNVLVGGTSFLKGHVCAFIRLKHTILIPELTEVPVPTRFIFMLLGNEQSENDYHEVGRAVATVMADEVFAKVLYGCKTKEELVVGMDVFLDATTVLPPSTWNPEIRINPQSLPHSVSLDDDDEDGGGGHGADPALARTGRIFGGLVADLKRKIPWYMSDWRDGLNMQCLAAFFFMYFAVLAPVVTFGGMLADSTGNNMAALENVLGALICGCSWHIFSGQPLCILGPTGPILVCEMIVYELCKTMEINYLPFRFWINIWMAIILLIIIMTDASSIIKYITRFTEESFATLIAVIFIVKSLEELKQIQSGYIDYVVFAPNNVSDTCECVNNTGLTKNLFGKLKPDMIQLLLEQDINVYGMENTTDWVPPAIDYAAIPLNKCVRMGGQVVGDACAEMHNVFFMSLVLTFGTYILATTLKGFRHKYYFPTWFRSFLSDFSTSIAIFLMAALDWYCNIDTPKLLVPENIRPTNPARETWLVNPFNNPIWTIFVAMVPAVFVSVLIFMDQQITTVIINRQENKLRKGAGYHLDLLVIAAQLVVTGILGFPVFVAATVRSMNHVNALKITSEAHIPGDIPAFEGCREQRLTGTLTSLAVGLSVFLSPVLKMIPMPVLYGVFLYMGISALDGIQLVDRLLLMLMPMKYQPDYAYLRHVNLARVHLFTATQIAMLVILWIVKSTKQIAIAFPLMLIVMVICRSLMSFVFTKKELANLDDQMPELFARMKEDHNKKKTQFIDATKEKIDMPQRNSLSLFDYVDPNCETATRHLSFGEKDIKRPSLKFKRQSLGAVQITPQQLELLNPTLTTTFEDEQADKKTD